MKYTLYIYRDYLCFYESRTNILMWNHIYSAMVEPGYFHESNNIKL